MKLSPIKILVCGFLAASGMVALSAQAVTCQNNLVPSNPDEVYVDHSDGTVTDTRTGLMWKQCVEGLSGNDCTVGIAQFHSWPSALNEAESSNFAGYNDWRLPNIKELVSLVEECKSWPAINDKLFPSTPNAQVWSGSPDTHSVSTWYADFLHGTSNTTGRNIGGHVRLIRDLQ